MNEPINFASGHRCVDNGLGDYDLICPTVGRVHFVPYLLARCTLEPQMICRGCGQPLGDGT